MYPLLSNINIFNKKQTNKLMFMYIFLIVCITITVYLSIKNLLSTIQYWSMTKDHGIIKHFINSLFVNLNYHFAKKICQMKTISIIPSPRKIKNMHCFWFCTTQLWNAEYINHTISWVNYLQVYQPCYRQ